MRDHGELDGAANAILHHNERESKKQKTRRSKAMNAMQNKAIQCNAIQSNERNAIQSNECNAIQSNERNAIQSKTIQNNKDMNNDCCLRSGSFRIEADTAFGSLCSPISRPRGLSACGTRRARVGAIGD